jgi:hypothetical protein
MSAVVKETFASTLSPHTANATASMVATEVIAATLSPTTANTTANISVNNGPPDIVVMSATVANATVSITALEAFRRHNATILGTM